MFTDPKGASTKGHANVAAGVGDPEPPRVYRDDIAARIAAVSAAKRAKAVGRNDADPSLTDEELDQVLADVRPIPQAQEETPMETPAKTDALCPDCGSKLGGVSGTRCYRCKPSRRPSTNGHAHAPVNRIVAVLPPESTPAPEPEPAPVVVAGELEAFDPARELRDLAAIVDAVRSLSPASRRWLAESLTLSAS